ncbi:hypothetical protein C8R44DRAFT_11384 [Mycena epipterygia]|nr:hypothetical protein C8R44DRAFT_11384 [Mycena epipterygia]
MVEYTLREGLSTSRLSQVAVESERLVDGQVRLDREHRSSHPLLLAEHLSATLVQATVDASNSILRTLDLDWRSSVIKMHSLEKHTYRGTPAPEE